MEQFKNRRMLLAAVTVSALLLVSAILVASNLGSGTTAVFSGSGKGTASLSVNVVEGYTETPIAGAQVVVIETGKTYETDENGMTDVIEVPFVRDTRFDRILEKPWGEVSLIVYKDGFVPYALFYLQVLGGQTREGVKILLFEHDKTQSNSPFSIIEGPNRAWVDALVEMHKPKELKESADSLHDVQ